MSTVPSAFTAWSAMALKFRCDHCGAAPLDWCRTYRGTTTDRLHRKRFLDAGWLP